MALRTSIHFLLPPSPCVKESRTRGHFTGNIHFQLVSSVSSKPPDIFLLLTV